MRALNLIRLTGVTVFVFVCTAVQFLRADLRWMHAPLSFYLIGPGGAFVRGAYYLLSASLVAIGIGFLRGLAPAARSAAPALLFAIAGAALTVTAASENVDASADIAGVHTFVHQVAAMTTFLCVTVAMLVQSWRLRDDPRWRRRFAFAFGLACAAFVALWIYAVVPGLPRGLAQKTVIALIVWWLGWASLALARGR